MECSLWPLATAIILLFLISTIGADEFATTAESPETSLLCISECGTCPTVCVSPPPPPPPQSPLIILTPPHDLSPPVNKPPPPPPPPPQVKPYSFSPVTPTQNPTTSSPVSGQKGSPTPYYYFYTSKATHVEVFSIWSLTLPLYIVLALRV
jgi:hypothetical protein